MLDPPAKRFTLGLRIRELTLEQLKALLLMPEVLGQLFKDFLGGAQLLLELPDLPVVLRHEVAQASAELVHAAHPLAQHGGRVREWAETGHRQVRVAHERLEHLPTPASERTARSP